MKRCTKTMKPIEKMDTQTIQTLKSKYIGFPDLVMPIDDPIRVKINEIIDRINDLPKRKGKK